MNNNADIDDEGIENGMSAFFESLGDSQWNLWFRGTYRDTLLPLLGPGMVDERERNQRSLEVIGGLLAEYGKDVAFSDLLTELERTEYGARYFQEWITNHVTHAVLVYMLGCYLFANIKRKVRKGKKTAALKPFAWKLSALLHDIGYPLEIAVNVIRNYIKGINWVYLQSVTGIESNNGFINLDQDRASTIRPITHSVTLRNLSALDSGVDAGLLLESRLFNQGAYFPIRQYWEDCLRSGRFDHGIFSALVVLKVIDSLYVINNPEYVNPSTSGAPVSWDRDYFLKEVVDAAAAIAVHNLGYKYCVMNRIKLEFDKAPLAYLLVFADELQIWKREKRKQLNAVGAHGPAPWEIESRDVGIIFEPGRVRVRISDQEEREKRKRNIENKLVFDRFEVVFE